MIRGFNDDLMYADAAMDLVILISHLSCASIRYEGWILVGNHSHSPVWWAGWVALVTEDQDLWGSHVLISSAEGTQNGIRNVRAHGPLRSFGGDDDPAIDDGIFSKFRHKRVAGWRVLPGRLHFIGIHMKVLGEEIKLR